MAVGVLATVLHLGGAAPVQAYTDVEHRAIHFPVQGAVRFYDDFGNCRGTNCSRRHEGNDLMGSKLQRLVAARDATVRWMRLDGSGNGGNLLSLRDSAGWEYWYIHINNDNPGTDDGAGGRRWAIAPGISVGTKVKAGQFIAYLGDSGNAEGTAPHLHFEIHRPDGTPINPYASLRLAQGIPVGTRCAFNTNPPRTQSTRSGAGYWTLGRDGAVFSFGAARFHGSMGGKPLARPVVGMTATKSGKGYWQVASDGGIFAFGDAPFRGSMGGKPINRPVVGITATKSGNGYWMVASDGGIFSFGDARFRGSTGNIRLSQPIIAMTRTPSGNGYWMVASDGGIFSFGDARFRGALPGIPVFGSRTAAGMAPTPTGLGYWITTTDGHVYPFGDAKGYGSPAAYGLCSIPRPTSIRASATGKGYWVQTADGKTWAYGDAQFYGDLPALGIVPWRDVVDLAVLPPRQ